MSREVSTQPRPLAARPGDDELLAARLIPRRRPWQWLSAVIVLAVVGVIVNSIVNNPRYHWDVVAAFFLRPSILDGLVLTIWLTAAVLVSAYVLGVVLAVMRLSSNPVLSTVSFGYIWLFRSVPPLLQLLFWYQMASLYPRIDLGIPFVHHFATVHTQHLFSGILAAFLGLTFDMAAFAAEIVRGGLVSVEAGQTEAAKALGMSKARIFWRIVLPQAMPAIIPASGNLLIGLLKGTSIVSVIAVQDLLYSVQLIYAQNYLIIPLLLVATIWYLVLVTILSTIQFFVERYYSRGKGDRRGFWSITRENLPLVPRQRRELAVI